MVDVKDYYDMKEYILTEPYLRGKKDATDDISKAIKMLIDLYGKADTLPHVRNKLGWALYHTWVHFDKEIKDGQ